VQTCISQNVKISLMLRCWSVRFSNYTSSKKKKKLSTIFFLNLKNEIKKDANTLFAVLPALAGGMQEEEDCSSQAHRLAEVYDGTKFSIISKSSSSGELYAIQSWQQERPSASIALSSSLCRRSVKGRTSTAASSDLFVSGVHISNRGVCVCV
jgi:hypothetical protein